MEISRYDTAISPETLAEQVKGAGFKNAVAKVPPHLFKLPEDLLETQLNPTAMDYEIKKAFWLEYQIAKTKNLKIDIGNVYKPICTYTHFYNNILNRPPKLAWILAPVSRVLYSLERFEDLILRNIFEILRMKNSYRNGGLNTRVASAQIKVFEVLMKYHQDSSTYKGDGGEGM